MLSTFKYRVLQSAWGIAIDVVAEFVFSRSNRHAVTICDGVGLIIDDRTLPDEHYPALQRGVAMMAETIKDSDVLLPVGVRIAEVRYNLTDFQSCGIQWAVAGWIAGELGTTPPKVEVSFDSDANRYVFEP